MTDQIRAVDCPSCGAPLEIPPGRKRFFQCEFCGTTLEDQSTPQERATGQYPKITIHTASIPATTLAPEISRGVKHTLRTLGCMFIILAIAGVVIAVVALGALTNGETDLGEEPGSSDQPEAPRVYNFGLARLLPSDNDSKPDVVGITRNSDDTERMVYVDFEAAPYLRWQSKALGKGAGYVYNPVVASGAFVYMAYETTLVALDRGDGTLAWQAELSDKVLNICEDCLQVFGARVVALTADGVLHGYDAQSGEPAWSIRLNETPRQLLNLAGKAGVLDKEDDAVGINIYEPASGTLVQRLVPQCPNEVFPDHPQTLRIYDPVLVSEDGQNLYVPLGSYEPGCIQNWDAGTLTQVWQAILPRDAVRALDRQPYLLTPGALYASDGHNLSLVSLQDGAYEELFSDEDHNLIPLAAQGDRLVALAERTRGTRRYALWGVDSANGSKRWQFDPQAEELYDEGSSVVHDDGLWSAGVTPGQVVVLEAFADPSFVSFTALNLADGAQVSVNQFTFDDASASFWIEVLGWGRDRVYLEMGGHLRVMDFMTATEIAAWP
jgi:outer membrane protein assembly factor BamB